MSDQSTAKGCGVVLVIVAFIFILILSMRGCTDPEGAIRVLQQNDYTDIKITGHRWFGGSQGDTYITGFEARSPKGNLVTGVVTSGWFKGSTIRFD